MKKIILAIGIIALMGSCCKVDKKKVSDMYSFKGEKISIDGETYYVQDEDTIKPKYFLYE